MIFLRMNALVVECARSWIDVKFLYRGHKRVGCDCVGFVIGVLEECGIEADFLKFYFLHSAGNGRYVDSQKIIHVFQTFFVPVEYPLLEEGDFVLFSINRQLPNHLGLVSKVNPVYFIHAHRGVGRVVENIYDDFWVKNVWGFFRYKL